MPNLDLTGYHLTFDDEFGSFTPEQLGGPTWEVTIFSGDQIYGAQDYASGSDARLAAYLSAGGVSPFSVGNGVLSITATPNTPGSTSNYTTGLIDNRAVFSQSYGYFEMRAELPAGAGLWPGFWMMPTVDAGGQPEIDAMEAFGSTNGAYGGSNQVHYDVHSDTNPSTRGNWATVNANIYNSYNTYGVMWTPTTLTFYVNGQSIGSLPTPSNLVGNPGEYLLASLLTGSPGDWPGPMAGESGTLRIDYIRAFSSSAASPAVPLQAVSTPDSGGATLYGATTAGGSAASAGSSSSSTAATPTAAPPVASVPVASVPVASVPVASVPVASKPVASAPPTVTVSPPQVTITASSGASSTLPITGKVSASGDTFSLLSDGSISAVLGRSSQTLSFQGASGVTVTGGRALDVVSVDGGTNSFTAGSGGLEVTGTAGANTFNIAKGAGLITIDHFTASDILVAPVALRGLIRETAVNGGSMLQISGGRGSHGHAVFLQDVANFDLHLIAYQ